MIRQSPPPRINQMEVTPRVDNQLLRATGTFVILLAGQLVAIALNLNFWNIVNGDNPGPHSPSNSESQLIIGIFLAVPMVLALGIVEYASRIENLQRNYTIGFLTYGILSANIWYFLFFGPLSEPTLLALSSMAGSVVALGLTTLLGWRFARKTLNDYIPLQPR